MDKKEIYEHLARIYLDASSKKKKKTGNKTRILRNLFLASLIFIFLADFVWIFAFKKSRPLNSEVALVLSLEPLKINFNFNPAKKETFSLGLNNLNLGRFRALGFSVKKTNFQDKISLRVEFVSSYREKSEVYFKDIPHKWQDFRVALSKFPNISDWSRMSSLIFTIEEWNTKEKKGIVYVDNVRLLE